MVNTKPSELLNVVRQSAKLCLFMVGAATAVVGCAAEDVDSPEGVADVDGTPTATAAYGEGLTIVRQDPKWGLTAVFKEGARALLIERRISAIKARAGEGEFEEDMLVTDAEGRVIYLKQGGDDTVEPSWRKHVDAEFALAPVDMKQRAEDLLRLERATVRLLAIPEIALDTAALVSVDGMSVVARTVLEGIGAVRSDLTQVTAYQPSKNKIELFTSNVVPGIQDGQIQHSATWTNMGGTLFENCNHGSGNGGCPSSGGMSKKGSLSRASNSKLLKMCSTAYDATSGGNYHNCHDDSVIQMRAFAYGENPSLTSGPCGNGNMHLSAPAVGYNSGW